MLFPTAKATLTSRVHKEQLHLDDEVNIKQCRQGLCTLLQLTTVSTSQPYMKSNIPFMLLTNALNATNINYSNTQIYTIVLQYNGRSTH